MNQIYNIEDTNFTFRTNWAGEYRPEDEYPEMNGKRTGDITIPDPDMAYAMMEEGFNVKTYQPKMREGDTEPRPPVFYVKAWMDFKPNWERRGPVVCIVDDNDESVRLGPDEVKAIDNMRIKKDSVCVTLSRYDSERLKKPRLYVTHLYVKQETDRDNWINRYPRRPNID